MTKRNPSRGQGPPYKRPEGQIRQSQLVIAMGPGAMVDLVDRAVVIGGLEHWKFGSEPVVALDDERLRRSLVPRLKALDPNMDLADEGYFRLAPQGDSRDPSPEVGVRALEFPRWFVCQSCHRLARAGDAFEKAPKTNRRQGYRHQCRPGIKPAPVVPVRFVAACRSGHLSDFPWVAFCHAKGNCERPELYLREGATGDVARILVQCGNCGASQPMSRVSVLPFRCQGNRPWLGGQAASEECTEPLRLLVRTASNAYFAQVVSSLRLPEAAPDELTLRLQQRDVWRAVRKVTRIEELELLASLQDLVASAVHGESLQRVLAVIKKERDGAKDTDKPLRSAEYERFLDSAEERPGVLPPESAEFASFRVPRERADLVGGIKSLVLVPELREVRVQVSFSRFDTMSANLQGEYDFDKYPVKPALLTLPANDKWLPAAEVRGEGLFFDLDPDTLARWEARPAVVQRAEMLLKAFESDVSHGDFPGVRFYLLHSLAHLLLTAISLECGYAASAIRERIYCSPPSGRPAAADGTAADGGMAGILLSTGTTGSEGTLGGLVEEGRRLRYHLRQAWDHGRLCSNDPVCAAHDPTSPHDDRRLEGAACHGCLFVAECSCERFNRFLDRALVVPTLGNPKSLAYFEDRP